MLLCVFNGQIGLEKVSKYDQEIPQLHTADHPGA